MSTGSRGQEVGGQPRGRGELFRQKLGSPGATIFAALAVVAAGAIMAAVFLLPSYLVRRDLGGRAEKSLTATELLKAKNDVRTTLLQAIGGLILLAGAVATWRQLRLGREQLNETQRQNREQVRLSREEQFAERFTRGIDQLGKPGAANLDIRLGGIYALERIAKDSERDHGPVMEVLTAFLRSHPRVEQAVDGATADTDKSLEADLQAAASVVGRRNAGSDPADRVLDLSRANLRGADLNGANLEQATLYDADLAGARLGGANLQQALLGGANLEGANLFRANLWSASFSEANLQHAILVEAHLEGAELDSADLRHASLGRAIFEQAHLRRANLQQAHLVGANLRAAVLDGANLQGAQLFKADLRGAYLLGTDLQGASLGGAKLEGAYLMGANLDGAFLSGGAQPEDAAIGDADLHRALANERTIWPAGFDPVAAGVQINTDPAPEQREYRRQERARE